MLAMALGFYGFLASFVLSSTAHNRRHGKANPAILTAVGYVLCGISAGTAAMLPIWAALDAKNLATLANLAL